MLSVLFYTFFIVCLFVVVVVNVSQSTLPQNTPLLPSLGIIVFTTLALALLDGLYNQSSLENSNQLLTEIACYTTTPYVETHLLFPFAYVFILITTTSLLVTLSYSISNSVIFLLFTVFISAASSLLFAVNSLTLFFVCYELFLVPSFVLLFSYAKTRSASEAAFLMFFWTQFGAFFLLVSILVLSTQFSVETLDSLRLYPFTHSEINFFVICWFLGFGVKIPVWPFYEWLPKAHVEAPTNFSIFLSGVLVKFAFFGFMRFLSALQGEPTCSWVLPILMYGLFDASSNLCVQVDINNIIAYATVVEMHWLVIAVVSGQTTLWYSALAMLISHALISSNSFLIVDSIASSFQTRLITEIYGVSYLTPKLFLLALVNLVVFLGFPGTLFFIAEFLFFTFLIDYSPTLFCAFLVPVYLVVPVFFFKVWFTVLWSYNSSTTNVQVYLDLDNHEILTFMFLNLSVFYLGITFTTWGA